MEAEKKKRGSRFTSPPRFTSPKRAREALAKASKKVRNSFTSKSKKKMSAEAVAVNKVTAAEVEPEVVPTGSADAPAAPVETPAPENVTVAVEKSPVDVIGEIASKASEAVAMAASVAAAAVEEAVQSFDDKKSEQPVADETPASPEKPVSPAKSVGDDAVVGVPVSNSVVVKAPEVHPFVSWLLQVTCIDACFMLNPFDRLPKLSSA